MSAAQAVVCAAQAQTDNLTLRIPSVKTSLNLEGHSVGITAWGTVSATPSGVFQLAVTVDLREFQENLTTVLGAQLNRSDRCGERLSVERAVVTPAAPSGGLTAYVHYERFGCAKAFGDEVVKRLVGGNGVVEVNLTPSVGENGIMLRAQVQKVDADGSLGELLRFGPLGDSIREKIAASIQSAIQESADLKSTLPSAMESATAIQTVQFADGGSGRLWLLVAGEVRLSAEQLRDVAKGLVH